jgi:hypothetical protein
MNIANVLSIIALVAVVLCITLPLAKMYSQQLKALWRRVGLALAMVTMWSFMLSILGHATLKHFNLIP